MNKTFRRRPSAVVELIDESPRDVGAVWAEPPPSTRSIEAFEEFYRREYPRTLVLARVLAGAPAAEDLAQEVMLAAYRRWPQIAVMESPGGYVRGICLHQAASVTRRLIAERRALQKYAAQPSARLETLAADHEAFWDDVRSLPRRQAQSAALFYALDLSVADIAATLGCAEGTVKAHLARARAALADRLTDSEENS